MYIALSSSAEYSYVHVSTSHSYEGQHMYIYLYRQYLNVSFNDTCDSRLGLWINLAMHREVTGSVLDLLVYCHGLYIIL